MDYQMNHNPFRFVIFGDGDDYLQNMFADVIDDDHVEFIPRAIPFRLSLRSVWQRLFYRIHFNRFVNRLVNLPFKDVWYRHFYEGVSYDNLCFVFFMDALLPQYIPLFTSLKQKYPQAVFAVYLIDLVASRKGALDMSLIDRFMDIAVTYNKEDAETYGLLYYPNFISKLRIEDDPRIDESDFCFIGAAKDRAERINDLYQTLSKAGYRCDFIVYDDGKKGRLHLSDGIIITQMPLPYKEYLKHIVKSKCLVEIHQANANSFTLRVSEALLYGKKLLSDTDEIQELNHSYPHQFAVFRKDFDKKALDDFLYRNPPRERQASECETSAKGFLDFLTAHLPDGSVSA